MTKSANAGFKFLTKQKEKMLLMNFFEPFIKIEINWH